MFETLGLGALTPRSASLILGAALGVAFGALALASGLCLRRALAGPRGERAAAGAAWVAALAVAVAGTQAAVALGWIGFSGHRFTVAALPVAALVGGGLAFGVGMVMTRGCPARLTVLAATGNLRALVALVVFAVVALASLRGALAPARRALGSITVTPPADLAVPGMLPGLPVLWVAGLAVLAAVLAWRGRPGARRLALAAGAGGLVPVAWVGTGLVLVDDFDPIPFESLSYTGPWADGLFWAVAAVPPGFGTGLVAGTLAGAFALGLLRRALRLQGFARPAEMGRYLTGAVLMGFGGVAAGGCSIGAGLAGLPSLGMAAGVALAAIAAGGVLAGLADGAPRAPGRVSPRVPAGAGASAVP